MSAPVIVAVVVAGFAAGLGAGAVNERQHELSQATGDDQADTLNLAMLPPRPTEPSDAGGGEGPLDEEVFDLYGESLEGVDPEEVGEDGLSLADRWAGLTSTETPRSASGELLVVPGEVAGPGDGTVYRVRVEVEDGLDVDGYAFADFVMEVLNDPRGWGAHGDLSFAQVDGEAEMRVVLATPDLTDAMCAPLRTEGRYSCGRAGHAVLNATRWVEGQEEFATRTQYRQYLVNHEVGHLLGRQHVACTGAGDLAPVMQQQSIQVAPCLPNGWPYPDA